VSFGEVFYRFGAALVIGFLVGIQREYAYTAEDRPDGEEDELFAGARTFALLSVYGCACAFAGDALGVRWATPALAAPGFLLIVAAYIMDARRGRLGMTSEVAALMTVLVGVVSWLGHVVLAVALGVVTMTLLSLKLQIRAFARRLSRDDVYAAMKFAIITALVLPVLPRSVYGPAPFDVLVPYNIWLMVVLISGIGFLGYVLVKIAGPRRGVVLSGILGGLVSSTAVTLSMSQRSRSEASLSRALALGVMAAWSVMFARILVIVAVLNGALFLGIWKAVGLGLLACTLYAVWLYRAHRQGGEDQPGQYKNPFELMPALTFGLLYAAILLGANAARFTLGDAGVYLSSIVSGLVDVDAITLSMARLAGGQGGVDIEVASRSVVLAVVANTLVKGCIVLLTASREVARLVIPGMLLALGTTLVVVFMP